jgi:trehalose 6-phosphate synthase
VNKRFAEMLRPLIGPGDVIWVHDYHLIPLARELRELGVENPIGFFLPHPLAGAPAGHHPAASPPAGGGAVHLRPGGLPHRRVALGFPRLRLVEAAASCWRATACAPSDAPSRPAPFPSASTPTPSPTPPPRARRRKPTSASSRAGPGGRWSWASDRLDYSKGLEERFAAYEQFLADNPDLREQVFLLQIAPPSREDVEAYQEIRGKLEALTGHINGAYATIDWVPVRYVNTSFRRDELAGIYRASTLGMVTPMRDGMNLVAKEYVAAQDPDDPGVLILSRFAGAALQLKEALVGQPLQPRGRLRSHPPRACP